MSADLKLGLPPRESRKIWDWESLDANCMSRPTHSTRLYLATNDLRGENCQGKRSRRLSKGQEKPMVQDTGSSLPSLSKNSTAMGWEKEMVGKQTATEHTESAGRRHWPQPPIWKQRSASNTVQTLMEAWHWYLVVLSLSGHQKNFVCLFLVFLLFFFLAILLLFPFFLFQFVDYLHTFLY